MSHEKFKTLHLFAGAGGGLLADLILGHDPVCAVEWDSYCCQILRERAAEGWFPGLQVYEGDVRLFDPSDWKGRVGLIHAGFPCPPFSVAGKRRGGDDERNMWPTTARIVGEVRPEWVFLENVAGFVSSGYGWTVLSDLSGLGYDALWTCLGADQVGAPHERERWWLLAHTKGRQINKRERGDVEETAGRRESVNTTSNFGGADVADAGGTGRTESTRGQLGSLQKEAGTTARRESGGDDATGELRGWWDASLPFCGLVDGVAAGVVRRGWWEEEPDIGRVTKGEESRVAKLKALGNGQVPLQSATAFTILMGQIGGSDER